MYQRTAKVRRNRRVFLRALEAARLRARDRRYPRTGGDRFRARRAVADAKQGATI